MMSVKKAHMTCLVQLQLSGVGLDGCSLWNLKRLDGVIVHILIGIS